MWHVSSIRHAFAVVLRSPNLFHRPSVTNLQKMGVDMTWSATAVMKQSRPLLLLIHILKPCAAAFPHGMKLLVHAIGSTGCAQVSCACQPFCLHSCLLTQRQCYQHSDRIMRNHASDNSPEFFFSSANHHIFPRVLFTILCYSVQRFVTTQ